MPEAASRRYRQQQEFVTQIADLEAGVEQVLTEVSGVVLPTNNKKSENDRRLILDEEKRRKRSRKRA